MDATVCGSILNVSYYVTDHQKLKDATTSSFFSCRVLSISTECYNIHEDIYYVLKWDVVMLKKETVI